MAGAAVQHFMDELQRLEETGDVERFVPMFTADAELSNLSHHEPFRGVDGVRRFWRQYCQAFDGIHSEFVNVTEANSAAALEWTAEGALKSGQPCRYRGVTIIELTDGQVKRLRAYYDTAALVAPNGRS